MLPQTEVEHRGLRAIPAQAGGTVPARRYSPLRPRWRTLRRYLDGCRAIFSCGRRLTARQTRAKQRNYLVPCAPLTGAHGTRAAPTKACLKKPYRRVTPTRELAMQHLQVVNVVMLIEPMEIGQHIWKAVAEAVDYSAALILNVYTHDGLPNDGVNTRVVLIPR